VIKRKKLVHLKMHMVRKGETHGDDDDVDDGALNDEPNGDEEEMP
jgi:hypothetical protein